MLTKTWTRHCCNWLALKEIVRRRCYVSLMRNSQLSSTAVLFPDLFSTSSFDIPLLYIMLLHHDAPQANNKERYKMLTFCIFLRSSRNGMRENKKKTTSKIKSQNEKRKISKKMGIKKFFHSLSLSTKVFVLLLLPYILSSYMSLDIVVSHTKNAHSYDPNDDMFLTL